MILHNAIEGCRPRLRAGRKSARDVCRRIHTNLLGALVFAALMLTGPLARADEQDWRNFAVLMGLEQVDRFVDTVQSIEDTGRLPDYYVTKQEARVFGWSPGTDLCRVARDYVIGGNRFGNYEGRLPDSSRRRWFEADLDFDCGRRGARRLVFSNDGLIFVTLDHYETFFEVPE